MSRLLISSARVHLFSLTIDRHMSWRFKLVRRLCARVKMSYIVFIHLLFTSPEYFMILSILLNSCTNIDLHPYK
jgi:hypothetical protein